MKNDEALLEELVAWSKSMMTVWENQGRGANQIEGLQNLTINKIKNHNLYSNLKKYWHFNEKDEIDFSLEDKKAFLGELKSLTGVILFEFYTENKKWLEKPTIKSWPNWDALINQEIKKVISNEKKKERFEWYRPNTFGRDDESGNINQNKSIYDAPPPVELTSQEELEDESAINKVLFQKMIFDKLLIRLKETGAVNNKKRIVEAEAYIRTFFSENINELLQHERESKPIYKIAKEKDINFRRLLYTLKTIKFPLRNTKIGKYLTAQRLKILKQKSSTDYLRKYSNDIHGSFMPLFEKIYPQIKQMWQYEDNYKAWTDFLKKKMRWEKSRVSKFMKRRMESKIVPVWWFDLCPPPISPKFLLNLVNRKMRMGQEFDNFIVTVLPPDTKLEEIYKSMTHQGIKEQLKEDCLNFTKDLLTSKA